MAASALYLPLRRTLGGRALPSSLAARQIGRWAPACASASREARRSQSAAPGLKRRIGISCRLAELEAFEDRRFLTVRGVGHGAGHGGTHEHRIWHGRHHGACSWGFHGCLCLCLSRGSSRRGGGEASKTRAGGEGRTARAAPPDGDLKAV